MKKYLTQQTFKRLALGLFLLAGLPLAGNAQLLPGYLSGQATVGKSQTFLWGNLTVGNSGELFLGTHFPYGLKTFTLNLNGNYTGVEGSRVYHSIIDNSNAVDSRGYISISGTATKTGMGTNIELDPFPDWDGTMIDLIQARKDGSDPQAFRMTPVMSTNTGKTAILKFREEGDNIIWFIADRNPCLDLIVQRVNTTLMVNNNSSTNGGYRFAHYTWYKGNELIGSGSGDHNNLGGHYYTGGASLDPYSEYWVEVITVNGEHYRSCPYTPVIHATGVNIIAYPNPVDVGNTVMIKISGIPEAELQTATIDVYYESGQYIGRHNVNGLSTLTLDMPPVTGVYVLQFKSESKEQIFKVIVK